jgi:hypothetical protein
MMEEGIHFVAKYGDWLAVKKLKIDESTDALTIVEFLASVGVSFDRKIEETLRKLVALERVDNYLKEKASLKNAEEVLAALKSRELSRIINEIVEATQREKKEKKELVEFCKIYATRKLLKQAKLSVDYSDVEIPSIKAAKRALKKARV